VVKLLSTNTLLYLVQTLEQLN